VTFKDLVVILQIAQIGNLRFAFPRSARAYLVWVAKNVIAIPSVDGVKQHKPVFSVITMVLSFSSNQTPLVSKTRIVATISSPHARTLCSELPQYLPQ
jgi:hypothetical protein